MRSGLISIIHVADLSRIVESYRDSHFWCCFSTDPRIKGLVEKRLGDKGQLHYGMLLDEIARKIKQPYLDWLAELGSKQNDPLSWWATQFASKSPYQSDFFLLTCYLFVFRRLVENERSCLFVVDDEWFYQSLKQNHVSDSRFAFLSGSRRLSYQVSRLRQLALQLVSRMYFGFSNVALLFRAARLFEREPSLNADVLLFSWVEDRSFQGASFVDPYTGGLAELYERRNRRVLRITQRSLSKELLTKLKELKDSFVVSTVYASLQDVLWSAFQTVRIDQKLSSSICEGLDLYHLIEREELLENVQNRYRNYLLDYRAFYAIARSLGNTPILIYPFENQPWEKMLLLAFKRSTTVKSFGYQHASVPSLLLNYFLGRGESDVMPLPDYVVANGPRQVEALRHAQYGRIKVVEGGAFRYKNFEPIEMDPNRPQKQGKITIGIFLPVDIRISEVIIAELNSNTQSQFHYLVKLHPDLHRLGKRIVAANVEVFEGNVGELLQCSDYVVYSGTSVGLEAMYGGKRVCRFQTEYLDIDSVEEFGEVKRITKLDELLDVDSIRKVDLDEAESPFSAVDESLWLSFCEDSMPGRSHSTSALT